MDLLRCATNIRASSLRTAIEQGLTRYELIERLVQMGASPNLWVYEARRLHYLNDCQVTICQQIVKHWQPQTLREQLHYYLIDLDPQPFLLPRPEGQFNDKITLVINPYLVLPLTVPSKYILHEGIIAACRKYVDGL